ncbi:MAG TPA: hypothetical protein VK933_17085 [Longimicrobiales bacterium]|nr:hypothetical protein [Longimicrobiales bacterium]
MAAHDIAYQWEDLPEYRCTQQLGRCIGRILVTLPRRYRRELGRVLIRGSIHIAQGIAGANAEMPPEDDLPREDREKFRSGCLASIEICRDVLRLLLSQKSGSVPDILVALELLERIDAGVRQRALPHA